MAPLLIVFMLFAVIGWVIVFSNKNSRINHTSPSRTLGIYKGVRNKAQREAAAALMLILGWFLAIFFSAGLLLLLIVALFIKK